MIENICPYVILVIFLEMEEVVKAKYLSAPIHNNIRHPS